MLKGLAELILDRLDWSLLALAAGLIMALAAVAVCSRSARPVPWRRMVVGAWGGAVAGALVAALLSYAANMILLHAPGANHAGHFHANLVIEAAKIGGALGGGAGAVVGSRSTREWEQVG